MAWGMAASIDDPEEDLSGSMLKCALRKLRVEGALLLLSPSPHIHTHINTLGSASLK